jgi:hypothetical protein
MIKAKGYIFIGYDSSSKATSFTIQIPVKLSLVEMWSLMKKTFGNGALKKKKNMISSLFLKNKKS